MQGPQGIQGIQGPTGIQGPRGLQGPAGIQGLRGLEGIQGIQGVQGIQGPPGPQGPPGSQGPQGVTGPQGIEGPQGPGFAAISNPDTGRVLTADETSDITAIAQPGLIFDSVNTRLGIGVYGPNFQLELNEDSAAKPTTTTWTVSSDERIKQEIEYANVDQCYATIKELPLRRFAWNPEYIPVTEDRHCLGFIAQEVKEFFSELGNNSSERKIQDCGFSQFEHGPNLQNDVRSVAKSDRG